MLPNVFLPRYSVLKLCNSMSFCSLHTSSGQLLDSFTVLVSRIRLPFLCHGSTKCDIRLLVVLQSLFISGLFHQVNEKTCNGVAVWTRYAMWRRSCCVTVVLRLLDLYVVMLARALRDWNSRSTSLCRAVALSLWFFLPLTPYAPFSPLA
jgi:hypothetical protein